MSKTLHIQGEAVTLDGLTRKGGEIRFTVGSEHYHFRSGSLPDGTLLLEQEVTDGVWKRMPLTLWPSGKDMTRVQIGALEATVAEKTALAGSHGGATELSPRAPMPGLVRQLLVKVGDAVKAGQALAVMEAMKLQLTLTAGADATVEALLVKEGEMIAEGVELVKLTATS